MRGRERGGEGRDRGRKRGEGRAGMERVRDEGGRERQEEEQEEATERPSAPRPNKLAGGSEEKSCCAYLCELSIADSSPKASAAD